MKYYLYNVIPPRPTFAADMTRSKSAIMSKHVAYWTDLVDKDPVIPESVTVMPPSRDHPNGRPSRPRKP
jgi:hypothetical protein